ncbi:MAG: SgcJ/EcaC family oxidoreductase [Gemmatimonadetes bacterium]|nr:SgcJ/EcaC family oxidoreductase [Gemmatimonadota bacterium]
MIRPLSAVSLGLALVATAAQGQLPAARRAALADTIALEANQFIRACGSLDINRFMDLFAPDPDLTYVDGGRIYLNRDSLARAAGGFFKSLRKCDGRWDPAHIVVLGPDAATFTGVFHADVVDTAGVARWTAGKIWTFVYQRRGGMWKIVQAHEANVPPPRPR